MAIKTHYETLGVAPTADWATLRAAYLTKAREVHPDRHVSDPAATQAHAARAMQQVNEAWAVLGDPTRRSRYDTDLAYAARRSAVGPTSPVRASSAPPPASTPASAGAGASTTAPWGAGYARPIPPDPNWGTPFVETGIGLRVGKVIAMLVLVGALVGVAVYVIATSISSRVSGPSPMPAPASDTNAFVHVGLCVEITSVLTGVGCHEPHDGFISEIIELDGRCPDGTAQIPIDPARAACVVPR